MRKWNRIELSEKRLQRLETTHENNKFDFFLNFEQFLYPKLRLYHHGSSNFRIKISNAVNENRAIGNESTSDDMALHASISWVDKYLAQTHAHRFYVHSLCIWIVLFVVKCGILCEIRENGVWREFIWILSSRWPHINICRNHCCSDLSATNSCHLHEIIRHLCRS